MDGQESQYTEETEDIIYSTRPQLLTADSEPSIKWTASNVQSIGQNITRQGSDVVESGKVTSTGGGSSASSSYPAVAQTSINTAAQVSERRPDFHPPLLFPQASQLPSFRSLVSTVDDPYDKNPIPLIAYKDDGSPHPSSSPIRKQYICYACKKPFPSKNSLSKHKQIHGERSHICSECNAKFHTKKDLTRHKDTVHSESSPNYVCPVPECARSHAKRAFSRRDNLRQHILQLHDKKYLDDIRNPQTSAQADRNGSRSPEEDRESSSPYHEQAHFQIIDEVMGNSQYDRVEIRTPFELITGEDNLAEEEYEAINSEDKDKEESREILHEAPRSQNLLKPEGATGDEAQDVIMSISPEILVQDCDVSQPQNLPEGRGVPQSQHPISEKQKDEGTNLESSNESDEDTWVINFLEDIKDEEIAAALKMSLEGLQAQYPSIKTKKRLKSVKSALKGYASGFERGIKAVSGILKVSTGSSTASLSIKSPSTINTSVSPITPISAISSALSITPKGFFGPIQQHIEAPSKILEAGRNSEKILATEFFARQTASANDNTEPEQYKCNQEKCQKIFTKKSEWKKHMQRHRRPFFCTFHWHEKSEVQRFGSKDDWRRHEEHRHYESEFYKCEGGPDQKCRGSWPTKGEFEQHLDELHPNWGSIDGLVNEESKREFLKKCHNGTDYVEDNFWCGFCAKLIAIPSENTGRKGKEIRVNHVADHFHKEQKDIRLWVKYNEYNHAHRDSEMGIAKKRYERERNLADTDLEALDKQRNLPPIKEIFGSGEAYHKPTTLAPPPVNPDFWICCECKYLEKNRTGFVHAFCNIKEESCSNGHPQHNRCSACSLA